MSNDINYKELLKQNRPSRWYVTEYAQKDPEVIKVWQGLYSHLDVQRFRYHFRNGKKKVYLIHAGRRSFKTETALRTLAEYACFHHNETLLYCAPTARQVSDIAWEALKQMIPKRMFNRVYEGDQIISLNNGSKIKLYSLDKPERVTGQVITGLVCDEFAYAPEESWNEIYPMIGDSDRKWAILISTPHGRTGQFFNLYNNAKNDPVKYKHFGLYHWNMAELAGSNCLDQYKDTVSSKEFAEKWLGQFVSTEGRAYYEFDRDLNVVQSTPLRRDLPIDITCDFNVQILPWSICQSTRDMTIVLDEVVGRECSIEHMCNQVKTRLTDLMAGDVYRAKTHLIRWYGDASALGRRDVAAHDASWHIIRDQFRDWNVQFKVPRYNPPPGDRIEYVNSRLKSAAGIVHCQINVKAKHLILDLEEIFRDDLESNKKNMGDRSHSSDGFGYYVYQIARANFSSSGIRSLSMS